MTQTTCSRASATVTAAAGLTEEDRLQIIPRTITVIRRERSLETHAALTRLRLAQAELRSDKNGT
jgi:hypothetical protein